MTRVHALERPPVASTSARGRWVAKRVGYGAIALVGAIQVVVLALDPIGFALVAPLLLLGVIAAVLFLLALASSLGEIRALLRDRETRVIHGLEHACASILERDGQRPLAGQTHSGFFELDVASDGGATVGVVRRAVNEAIRTIRDGHPRLAYHPRCGTSLLVAATLVATILVAGSAVGLYLGLPVRVVASATVLCAVLAGFAARPLGLLAQRLTVATRFRSASIHRIVRIATGGGRIARFAVYLRVRISRMRTARTRRRRRRRRR
jgi:hypothetical protein